MAKIAYYRWIYAPELDKFEIRPVFEGEVMSWGHESMANDIYYFAQEDPVDENMWIKWWGGEIYRPAYSDPTWVWDVEYYPWEYFDDYNVPDQEDVPEDIRKEIQSMVDSLNGMAKSANIVWYLS